MHRRIRTITAATFIVALAFAVLAGCGGGGDSAAPPMAPAGQTLRASIHSAQTGIDYGYYVYLPAGYQPTQAYPVIYATDSEYRFTTLSGVMQSRGTQAILVNIDATTSARRWVDSTMPGATAYFRFLTQELIPVVEARYRVDPTRRTFTGHSLSGEFVIYALYLEDPAHRYFASIISEEGSFWYRSDMVFSTVSPEATALEQGLHDAHVPLPVNLMLAGDTTSNGGLVASLYTYLSARGYAQLRIANTSYTLGHVPMDGPAFTDALAFIAAAP